MKLQVNEYVPKSPMIPWDYIIYDICVETVEVGRVVFRYGTKEQLRYCGHIGYHIEEKYRGHNYAYQALQLLMKELQKEGYQSVLISCSPDNVASKKTIEKLPVLNKRLVHVIDDPEYQNEMGLLIYEVEVRQ